MQINYNKFFYAALSGTLLCMAIHLIVVLKIFNIPKLIVMLLTIGMIFLWLQTSRYIKNLSDEMKITHPWKHTFSQVPDWIKYLLYFFVVYAVLNFIVAVDARPSEGFFDFDVSQSKLRGLSGFWIVFYYLAVLVGYGLTQIEKKKQVGEVSDEI